MKFIKLKESETGKYVYINAERIDCIDVADSFSKRTKGANSLVVMESGTTLVNERPEDIVALINREQDPNEPEVEVEDEILNV